MKAGERNHNYLSNTGEYGRPPSVVGTDLPSEVVHEHPVQNAFGETITTLSNMGMILNKSKTSEVKKMRNKKEHKTTKEGKETH